MNTGHPINLHAVRRIGGIVIAVVLATIAAYVQMSGSLTGAVIKLPKQADLSVTRTAPESVLSANPITVSYDVGNEGPEQVKRIKLTQPWTEDLTVVSTTVTGGNATVSCRKLENDFFCSIASTAGLNAGEHVTFDVALRTHAAKDPAPCDRVYEMEEIAVAHNATGFADSNAGNDVTGPVAVRVDCSDITTDVSVHMDDDPSPAVAAGNMRYTLMTTNNGPGRTKGVKVKYHYPANLKYVNASISRCKNNAKAREVVCDPGDDADLSLGVMQAGQTATVELNFTVNTAAKCSWLDTDTSVSVPTTGASALIDPIADNNQTALSTEVACD